MRNISKKIILIVLVAIMLIAGMQAHVVYGKTEAEELKEQLEQNEENLGNLNDFKVVVDEMYTDLTTATKVDDALKQKLKKDVENLNNVQGINPLIVSVLSIELNSQIDNLTDENLGEMQEEVNVIKDWVDNKISSNDNKDNNSNNNGDNSNSGNNTNTGNNISGTDNNQTNSKVDNTIANISIPKAGVKCIFSILVVIAGVGVFMFIKYRKLQDIK